MVMTLVRDAADAGGGWKNFACAGEGAVDEVREGAGEEEVHDDGNQWEDAVVVLASLWFQYSKLCIEIASIASQQ